MSAAISIIVPAYNEAAVIGAALAPLALAVARGELELIVVPNNCSDATAEVARRACPGATILPTATPGKTNAMNLGVAAASGEALIFLDADLTVSPETIQAVAEPLIAGRALAACGRMGVDTEGSSLAVRLFYQGWLLNPYHDRGKFGGMFALSRAKAHAIFPLPEITADDEYISRAVAERDTTFVPEAFFTVYAPRRLADLIKIRRRSRRGTVALAEGSTRDGRPQGLAAFRCALSRGLCRPKAWPGLAVYAGVVTWARLLVTLETRRTCLRWERDASSREARLGGEAL